MDDQHHRDLDAERVAAHLSDELDKALEEAVRDRLGLAGDVDMAGLISAERLTGEISPPETWTTYLLDGEPLIRVSPPRFEVDEVADEQGRKWVHAWQTIKQLDRAPVLH